jgi:hypothetical protein
MVTILSDYAGAAKARYSPQLVQAVQLLVSPNLGWPTSDDAGIDNWQFDRQDR